MADIVERLRAYVACDGGDLFDVAEAADEITRLRAQVAALEVDAGRWRTLRSMVRGERHLGTGFNQGFAFPSRFELPPLGDIMRGSVAQHLDAAIDAALAARKGD